MRIFHVVDRMDPAYGGPSRSVGNLHQGLLKRGIESVVFTTDGRDSGRISPRGWDPQMRVHHYRALPPVRRGVSTQLLADLWRRIPTADVVHCHGVLALTTSLAATFARMRRIPLIISPLGMLDSWGLQQRKLRKQAWIAGIDRPNLDAAEAVRVTSPHEEAQVQGIWEARNIAMIPHAIDQSAFRAAVHWKGPHPIPAGWSAFVLFVGRLHPKKGVRELVAGFAAMARVQESLGLVIAGDGEANYVHELEQDIANERLTARVMLTGQVDGALKTWLMQNAAMFALPSRDENFGVAVVEAAATGSPLLLTPDVGVAYAFHGLPGVVLSSSQPDSIAEGLAKLFADPRAAVGTAIAARASEHFSPDAVMPKMIQLYERAAAKSRK